MSVIGTLAVNIVAKTERFSKGIATSIAMTQRFTGAVSVASKALGAFTAAGVAAAAGGLTVLAKSQLTAIDSMAKFSDKIGINIESLVAYRLAAEETGVSANVLDTALQRMTRRIAEAGMGRGEAVGALNELGLSARMLARLKPEDQLLHIADAMNKVERQGDKVRLAMRLFDTEGVGLVNTLKLGSAGLLQYENIARRLGLVVSRELAAGVERANDAFNRLKLAFVGLGRQIAVRVAPILEHMSKWMEDLLTNDGRIHRFANLLATGIGKAIELALRGLREVKRLVLETTVLFRQGISEMLANPLVIDKLFKMGLSDKTVSKMAADNNTRLAQTENQLFRMGLDDKAGNTAADKFARFWFSHLVKAMETMEPKVERQTTSILRHFQNMVDTAETVIGGRARGLLQRFARDPQLQNAWHQLSFGFAGRPGQMAAGGMGAMAQRGMLAFAQAGSADSYRQQAAIRRQNEPMMQIAKEQLATQRRIAAAAEEMARRPQPKIGHF